MSETPAGLFDKGTIDVKGAERVYGLCRDTWFDLMRSGRLTYTSVGGKRLIPVRDIERLLSERAVVAAAVREPAVA